MEKHWGVKTKPKEIPNAAAQGPADGIDDEDWEPDEEGEEEEEVEAEGEEPKEVVHAEVKAEAASIKPDQAKSSHEGNGEPSHGASALPQSAIPNSMSPSPLAPQAAPPTPQPSAPLECRMSSGERGSEGGNKGESRAVSDHQPSTPPNADCGLRIAESGRAEAPRLGSPSPLAPQAAPPTPQPSTVPAGARPFTYNRWRPIFRAPVGP